MRRPRALTPGDRLEVVAPASPFPDEDFRRGAEELRQLGFEVTWEPSVFARTGYVAGTAGERAAAFMRAWRDPAVAGLIAARGGYGSVQILPLLPLDELARTPKLVVGCSDLTSVLTVLTGTCGVTAVHGPMVAGQLSRGSAGYDQATWRAATQGRESSWELAGGLAVLARGEAAGPLAGGNLTQLAASLGTPFAFDPPDGCVLFLEDVGERPYRIDRLLTQLRLSGALGRARALVFGEMLQCDEPGGGVTSLDAIRAAVDGFCGPIVAGLPAGHTARPAVTVPLGVAARVVAAADGAVRIESPAVERGTR